jgi:hypothetical protein
LRPQGRCECRRPLPLVTRLRGARKRIPFLFSGDAF